MTDALELILFLATLALSIAIAVPLTGVLVRYRANYNPKGLQLDAEGGAQPHTGPIIRSFFTMFSRVYRIEVSPISSAMVPSNDSPDQGMAGLYKGLSKSSGNRIEPSRSMFISAINSEHPGHIYIRIGVL